MSEPPASLQLSRTLQVSGVHAVNDLLTMGLMPALLPFLKQAHGLTFGQTGMISFCCLFTTSVTQPFFGWISDRRPAAWLRPTGLLAPSRPARWR